MRTDTMTTSGETNVAQASFPHAKATLDLRWDQVRILMRYVGLAAEVCGPASQMHRIIDCPGRAHMVKHPLHDARKMDRLCLDAGNEAAGW